MLDDQLCSCASHSALWDGLLAWLLQQEFTIPSSTLTNTQLVNQIQQHLCLNGIRPAKQPQRNELNLMPNEDLQPRLSQAIQLMHDNIEEPLTTDQIADQVYISRRQLERLFKRHLNTMPARYYMQLRLSQARDMLLNSNTSIVQIGLKCGFSSGPHFSSSYKAFYQITPREERSRRFAV